MKHLLACLTIIVYMNSGKVYTYTDGCYVGLSGGSQPLIGADTPNTVMDIKSCETYDTIASFPIRNIERWEIKK